MPRRFANHPTSGRTRNVIVGIMALAFLLSTGAQAAGEIATGIRLLESGQLAEARQFFTSFAAAHPDDPAGMFYLGRVAFSAAQYDEAIKWFAQAVQRARQNSDYHLWLGRAYGEKARRASVLQQPVLAIKVKEYFEKAVALNPDNLAARSDLREYYLEAPIILGGSQEKAREQAEEIRKREAQHTRP